MKLSWEKTQQAAAALGVRPCFIKAVACIESGGNGFDNGGRVTVRFEKHVFRRELKKRGVASEVIEAAHNLKGLRWETLDNAMVLHKEAALASASYGMFQIMGFNYAAAGFDSVSAFVEAQKQGEEQQLETFCTFARNTGLVPIMQKQDFAAFARRYNGPAYAANAYDKKLHKAYTHCMKRQEPASPVCVS